MRNKNTRIREFFHDIYLEFSEREVFIDYLENGILTLANDIYDLKYYYDYEKGED